MKILLLLIVITIIIYLTYKIWIKYFRRNEEIWLNNILFKEYLGEKYLTILQIIKQNKHEIIFDDGIKEKNELKYIYTFSPNQMTLKIYQFKEDICISFFIQSFEEKYSLPYWKYIKEYIEIIKSEIEFISIKQQRFQLAIYTISKFLQPYYDTEITINENDGFWFKNYYMINDERFLSIYVESPNFFPKSTHPFYSYLCSSSPNNFICFRNILSEESDLIANFVVDHSQLAEFNKKSQY